MFDCIAGRSISKFHLYTEYRTIFGNKKYYCLKCGSKIADNKLKQYKETKKKYEEAIKKYFDGLHNVK